MQRSRKVWKTQTRKEVHSEQKSEVEKPFTKEIILDKMEPGASRQNNERKDSKRHFRDLWGWSSHHRSRGLEEQNCFVNSKSTFSELTQERRPEASFPCIQLVKHARTLVM